jgi:prephenate dehydrogenase
MAGKERSGAAAADPALFKGAIYCLTPSQRARPQAIELVEAVVRQVQAKVYYIDAAEHDAYVAGISHLPFMLSAALVDLVSSSPGWKEMAPLAATGFRDISRLASGDVEMHRDICMTNQAAIARWLESAAQLLLDLRDQVGAGESDQLLEFFQRAHTAREEWLASRPNLRPGEDDFEDISGVGVARPSLFGRFGSRQPPRKR